MKKVIKAQVLRARVILNDTSSSAKPKEAA